MPTSPMTAPEFAAEMQRRYGVTVEGMQDNHMPAVGAVQDIPRGARPCVRVRELRKPRWLIPTTARINRKDKIEQ
jgi:hypothetical protein